MRKRGRQETHATDKLTRLQSDLLRAKELLEAVVSREILRKESFILQLEIFECRHAVRKIRKRMGIAIEREGEGSPERVKRKRETRVRIPLTKYREAMNDSELRQHIEATLLSVIDNAAMNDRAMQKKAAELKAGWVDCTELMFQQQGDEREDVDEWMQGLSLSELSEERGRSKTNPRLEKSGMNTDTIYSNKEYTITRGRRRVGRGGRIFIDQYCRYHPETVGDADDSDSDESGMNEISQYDDDVEADKKRKWIEFLKKKRMQDDEDFVEILPVEMHETNR